MNLLQIEYFLLLAKLGSFRKTAESLYVSQPAVSKQIAQLEKEWGVKLFHRKYKETHLTAAGQIMYDAISQSKADFQSALTKAHRAGSSIKTLLHIGIPEQSDFANLSDIFSSYQSDHPDVALNVEVAPIANLVLDRHNSGFDLVICHEYNLGDRSKLDTRILAKRQHTVVISQRHPLVQANPELEIGDLANLRVYIPAPEGTSLTVDYCKFICAHHGFTPQEVILLPNVNSVLLATKMCFGVAVLDDLVVPPENYELKILTTKVYFNLHIAWRLENSKPHLIELVNAIEQQIQLEHS